MRSRQTLLLLFFCCFIFVAFGQTDSLQLKCPLLSGVPKTIRASDKDYQKSSEYGIMISSKIDTTVQAVHDGAITIVARTEDTKYDVVIQFRNYYFWYAGVLAPKVKEKMKVKAGDIIGSYKPGEMLELMMFQAEEPVNPRKYLKCN